MRVSIEQYITINNPNAASQLLVKYGVQPATSLQDLSQKVEMITYKYKDLAFMDLANIDTPYRRLILSSNQNLLASEQLPTEVKSNCTGCGGTCGAKTSGADGKTEAKVEPKAPEKKEVVPTEKSSSNTMKEFMPFAVLGLFVIAIVVVAKH